MDRGTVAVYIKLGITPDMVQPLPIFQFITQIKNQRLIHYLKLNKIVLGFTNEDGTNPVPIGADDKYRFVIIPGGTPSGRLAPVNMKDYKAVKAYFNIPD
jgi:hypothetical protein